MEITINWPTKPDLIRLLSLPKPCSKALQESRGEWMGGGSGGYLLRLSIQLFATLNYFARKTTQNKVNSICVSRLSIYTQICAATTTAIGSDIIIR